MKTKKKISVIPLFSFSKSGEKNRRGNTVPTTMTTTTTTSIPVPEYSRR